MPKHTRQPHVRTIGGRTIAGLLCLILGALCGTTPFLLMVVQSNTTAAATSTHERKASQAASEQRQRLHETLERARDYNTRLASEQQQVIGEAHDPWDDTDGGESLADLDTTYQSQLDFPKDGIMATIRYSRLGIDLPIRHGTSDSVLSAGAGHLYGTSLPVGGENTHAVISAHTGLADQLMFDKLRGFGSQAKKGDIFYISVVGRTLAYKVTDINIVTPDDFSKLTIRPGEDLVTLLTCTPYGVNDHRLLVTGQRAAIPQQAPEPKDAPRDHTNQLFILYAVCFWIVIGLVVLVQLGVIRSGRHRPAAEGDGGRHIHSTPAPRPKSARRPGSGPDTSRAGRKRHANTDTNIGKGNQ